MSYIATKAPIAIAAVQAIHTGDLPTLKLLLAENPGLATARLGDDDHVECPALWCIHATDERKRRAVDGISDWAKTPGHISVK
jgi:hypothetical protein